jgi:tRNA threonylcarbamoyladenosine biosynthesis protein TsaB
MWLALDASTAEGSAAVLDGTTVLGERIVAMRDAHEEHLMPAVVEVVESTVGWGGLTRVFVGAGPGSFTSLRIAASIGKGIAAARGLELWAGSSLALVAADAALPGGRLAVALDAMRGEVFLAFFDRSARGLAQGASWRRLSRVDAAAATVDTFCLGMDGIPVFPRASNAGWVIAAGLAHHVSLDLWEPDYGRLAEAQVAWEAREGRSLPLDVHDA